MSGVDNGHLTLEQWRRYIHNEMTSSERERADQELLVCEGCMWLFMEALEETEMPDMIRLEDRVIAELLASAPIEAKESLSVPIEAPSRKPNTLTMTKAYQPKRRGSWLQHPAMQYTLAASITLLLIATGALTGFSEKLQNLEEIEPEAQTIGAEWRSEASWSERLVDKAGSFFDDVQAWRFK
jgi:hypothetical protein